MSAIEIIVIMMMSSGLTVVVIALVLRSSRPRLGARPDAALEEVARLRAEIRRHRRPSTFADMADALNRLRSARLPHDDAVLRLPIMDLALGKRVQVRLPSGKDVAFSLPAQTKSGTKFRFKRGGEDGRDLYLEVLSIEQDVGHG